jgi:hypothetical protein
MRDVIPSKRYQRKYTRADFRQYVRLQKVREYLILARLARLWGYDAGRGICGSAGDRHLITSQACRAAVGNLRKQPHVNDDRKCIFTRKIARIHTCYTRVSIN